MTLSERVRRWRFRQRREVGRALWMRGRFTRKEARVFGRVIKFKPMKAARLIRLSLRNG